MNEIQSRSNHNYGPGTALMTPLNRSIHTIEQASMNKVSKFVLFFLAYITFGLPAAIGLAICGNCLSGRAEVIVSPPLSVETDNKDKLYKIFEIANEYFMPQSRLDSIHAIIPLVEASNSTYDNGNYIEIVFQRAISENELNTLVDTLREGASLNEFNFEHAEVSAINFAKYGSLYRNKVSIKLMVPDQVEIKNTVLYQ